MRDIASNRYSSRQHMSFSAHDRSRSTTVIKKKNKDTDDIPLEPHKVRHPNEVYAQNKQSIVKGNKQHDSSVASFYGSSAL